MIAPELDDLFAPAAIADPYGHYARLRELDPVHWNDRYQLWVVTRYQDIVWMIRHHELFSSAVIRNDPRPPYPPVDPADLGLVGYVRQFRADQLVEHDRPQHLAMRQVVHGYFTPRTMESWRPFVRQAVAELLDEAEARGRMDVLTDLAAPLPVRVITQMMGVPPEDREHLRELADKLLYINRGEPDRLRPLTEGMRGMIEYVEPLVEARLRRPGADFISVLAQGEKSGVLTRHQVLVNTALLLFAGHETTMNLICNGTLALIRHPGPVGPAQGGPGGLGAAGDRGVPPLRPTGQVDPAHRGRGRRARRQADPEVRPHPVGHRLGQSRPGGVRGSRPLRHRPPSESPRRVRRRHPLLPRRDARARRGPGGLPGAGRALPGAPSRRRIGSSTSPASSSGPSRRCR